MKLSIHIEKQFSELVRPQWLSQVVEKTLTVCEIPEEAELSLCITNDTSICELNKLYRKIDKPTDVLAFALTEQVDGHNKFVSPPDGITHLGEIVISYQQATRQAKEYGCPPQQELARLVIHGVLHLLGFDHDTISSEKNMFSLQESILSKVPQS
ncbi:MAG: rRNA maturation RNase YbeY [Chloroflexota bacterium]|nr:rRNA maturation RNase YbeY [Chloroflexota bacterium]